MVVLVSWTNTRQRKTGICYRIRLKSLALKKSCRSIVFINPVILGQIVSCVVSILRLLTQVPKDILGH